MDGGPLQTAYRAGPGHRAQGPHQDQFLEEEDPQALQRGLGKAQVRVLEHSGVPFPWWFMGPARDLCRLRSVQ